MLCYRKEQETDPLIEVFNDRRAVMVSLCKTVLPSDPSLNIYKTFIYIVETKWMNICSVPN